jgi:hypothetical protein
LKSRKRTSPAFSLTPQTLGGEEGKEREEGEERKRNNFFFSATRKEKKAAFPKVLRQPHARPRTTKVVLHQHQKRRRKRS